MIVVGLPMRRNLAVVVVIEGLLSVAILAVVIAVIPIVGTALRISLVSRALSVLELAHIIISHIRISIVRHASLARPVRALLELLWLLAPLRCVVLALLVLACVSWRTSGLVIACVTLRFTVPLLIAIVVVVRVVVPRARVATIVISPVIVVIPIFTVLRPLVGSIAVSS